MKSLDALLLALRLIFLEKKIEKFNSSNSVQLIKDTIGVLETNSKKTLSGSNNLVIENLKEYIMSLVGEFERQDSYEPNLIKQSLLLIMDKKELIDSLIEDVSKESPIEEIQKRILRLRALLQNFGKEDRLKRLFNKISYDLNMKKTKIGDVTEYAMNAQAELETITSSVGMIDPNIVTEIDLNDINDTSEIIHKLQDEANSGMLLKTGFIGLNTVLDGGIRRGEFITVTAQQHNYKSGLVRSIFMQTMKHNDPSLIDKNKKPLQIFISFEDNARLVLKFMYEYLTTDEGTPRKIMDVSSEEAANYINDKLRERGWHIKILVVNPSGWGYKDIFNTVERYESKGYEVIGLGLDYLSLVPKIGCITNGATGSDTRDLFRRVGNYGRAKDMYIVTPHQSSSGVKGLLRNGVKDTELLMELYGRGYFADSAQLDQEQDVGILAHKVTIDEEVYLDFAIDKHRGFVLNPKNTHFAYKFPKNEMPIPSDLKSGSKAIKDLMNEVGNADLF